MYAFLRVRGDYGATTAELSLPSVGGRRFGARVLELRQAGCVIQAKCLRPDGRWRYWLGSNPWADVEIPTPTAAAAVPSDEMVLTLDVAA